MNGNAYDLHSPADAKPPWCRCCNCSLDYLTKFICSGPAGMDRPVFRHDPVHTCKYSSTTRVVTRVIFLLKYSLISISGCKFPFPVAVFLQSVDELLEFMQTWGFVISFATCQTGNRPEYCPFGAPGMLTHQFTTPFFVIGNLY